MPCACESGCVNGGAFGYFGSSVVQVLTESADANAKIFPWSMPARYYQKPGRMVVYGTCLVAGTTRKGDTFSKEELERHGCTLIHGPIEAYAHSWDDGGNHWLSYPENVILDAEEVDGELQYIAGIDDKAIKDAIAKKEITGVSVNTICRRVAADSPGVCQGMILNGFCLLGKDSTPASPGTSVKIWNCLRATVPLRLGGGGPCTCKTEKVDENTSKKPEETPGQKTEDLTGHGPAAGVPEPSTEDRLKTLEQRFESFNQFVTEQFTGINARLDTLIAVKTNAAAATPAAASPAQKTQQAGPIAASVPLDKLPAAPLNIKVEEIEAIVQDRALFTPVLKLNAILDLCQQKRTEAV
jgi:hypothetical protein